jgi:hypothetical protein
MHRLLYGVAKNSLPKLARLVLYRRLSPGGEGNNSGDSSSDSIEELLQAPTEKGGFSLQFLLHAHLCIEEEQICINMQTYFTMVVMFCEAEWPGSQTISSFFRKSLWRQSTNN